MVIEDGKNRSGNPALEAYKIRISADDIKKTGINHLFTNGMFNDHDTAVYNQQTQQGFADGILNYNQQHGIVGDLLESAQDHLSINGLDILKEVVTFGQAEGAVDGIGSLGTGGSRQTGNLINQMITIRNGDLTVGSHSQGTLMTQNGIDQQRENISNIVQGNTNANFLVQYSGSPVNHVIAEQLVTDIYGGEEALSDRTKEKGIDSVFRSNATPEDAVSGILGYNGAGINSSENLLSNIGASFIAIPRLFGVGDPSPHSYYPCVIGCGNDNYTPDIRNYYTPNRIDGEKEYSRMQYYQENFTVKDKKGQPRMTIDTNLLPSSSRTANTQVVDKVVIDTTGAK